MRNDDQLVGLLDSTDGAMTGRLTKALVSEAFNNRHTLHPRRLGEIATSLFEAYRVYLRNGDPAAPTDLGRFLSGDGVGLKSFRSAFAQLRAYCWEALGNSEGEVLREALEATDAFAFAVIEGVMAGREAYILAEQERLHRAYGKVEAAQRGESPGA